MARIRPAGQQKSTTAPPPRRIPGRNNRGGSPGHGHPGGGNNNRNRNQGPGGGQDPPVAAVVDPPPDPVMTQAEKDALARQTFADNNQAAYLQSTLGQAHGGLTGGTSYDTFLNDYYIPGQITDYNIAQKLPGGDLGLNFDEFVNRYTPDQQRLNAQFAYAHRPDTQRSLNPFEGGGSHWSWFD